jgi:hypothetical protein
MPPGAFIGIPDRPGTDDSSAIEFPGSITAKPTIKGVNYGRKRVWSANQRGIEEESGEPVTLTCYRIDLRMEGKPQGEMNNYSVVTISPEGEFSHHVFSAREAEDVGRSLRVPPGTRVIITQMADLRIWDSQIPEAKQGQSAESII